MLNDSPTQLQACIARMKAGDNAAKNELLRSAYERLRGLARKMLRQDFPRLKNWEQTDDVLQIAALRLDRALGVVPVASAAEFFRLAASAIRRELLDLARHYQPGREAAAGGASPLAESSGNSPPAADPSDSSYEPSRYLISAVIDPCRQCSTSRNTKGKRTACAPLVPWRPRNSRPPSSRRWTEDQKSSEMACSSMSTSDNAMGPSKSHDN